MNTIIFYFMYRPLIEPFSIEAYKLVGGIPLTSVFAIAVIVYAGLVCIFRKDFTFFAPNSIIFYFLLLLSSFSFLNSPNIIFSIGFVFKILLAVSINNLAYSAIKKRGNAIKLLWGIVIASIGPMFVGFYEVVAVAGHVTYHGATSRATGGFGFPNMYGIYLALVFCALLMLLLQVNKKTTKRFLVIILVSILVSSVLALNRGTWISLSFSIFVSSIIYRRKINFRWLIIGGILISLVFSGLIAKRFMELKETTAAGMSKNTIEKRMNNWVAILRLVPNHPIIGHGVGNSNQVFFNTYKYHHEPHNDYLKLLFEIGFLGPFFYFIFIFRELFRELKRSTNLESWYIHYPMLIGIIYFIIISFTQNIIHSVIVFPLFFCLLSISRKWDQIRQKECH